MLFILLMRYLASMAAYNAFLLGVSLQDVCNVVLQSGPGLCPRFTSSLLVVLTKFTQTNVCKHDGLGISVSKA